MRQLCLALATFTSVRRWRNVGKEQRRPLPEALGSRPAYSKESQLIRLSFSFRVIVEKLFLASGHNSVTPAAPAAWAESPCRRRRHHSNADAVPTVAIPQQRNATSETRTGEPEDVNDRDTDLVAVDPGWWIVEPEGTDDHLDVKNREGRCKCGHNARQEFKDCLKVKCDHLRCCHDRTVLKGCKTWIRELKARVASIPRWTSCYQTYKEAQQALDAT